MSDLISRKETIKYIRENLPLSTFMHRGVNQADIACWDVCNMIADRVPSAEPERKKGKWIEVYGYATPGGDPVWKCSECGKGIHVYGIEASSYNRDYTDDHQWVACPNCGADMRG